MSSVTYVQRSSNLLFPHEFSWEQDFGDYKLIIQRCTNFRGELYLWKIEMEYDGNRHTVNQSNGSFQTFGIAYKHGLEYLIERSGEYDQWEPED